MEKFERQHVRITDKLDDFFLLQGLLEHYAKFVAKQTQQDPKDVIQEVRKITADARTYWENEFSRISQEERHRKYLSNQ